LSWRWAPSCCNCRASFFYWREKNAEVDFVCRYQGRLYAIEVKSGRKKSAKGLAAFMQHFPEASPVILTPDNFPKLSEDPKKFLAIPVKELICLDTYQ
jgi:predicted AAA+ superfamily ATPase